MIKQIPNLLTLLNLFFGCMAITAAMQHGLTLSYDYNTGQQILVIPEKIFLASVFIAIAAVIDFFDGFVARLFGASSELGKQLDSLSDVVSFGVAPGIIVYQFLQLSIARHDGGIDSSIFWLLPAFIIPCAGAYRLGRFNLDNSQSTVFKGVPIPAAGLVIASFPLIYWYSNTTVLNNILLNEWFWYAVIFLISYLMVCTLPMKALKFSGLNKRAFIILIAIIIAVILCTTFIGWFIAPSAFIIYGLLSFIFKFNQNTFKVFLPFLIILIVALVSAVLLGWLAVPLAFLTYVIVSLIFK